MEKICVNLVQLLQAVKENRSKHFEDWKKAVKGWRLKVAEEHLAFNCACEHLMNHELDENTKMPDSPKILKDTLDPPKHYLKEYDRAIAMLEWHNGGEIQISEDEFARLVNDEWDWKERFHAINSKYGV